MFSAFEAMYFFDYVRQGCIEETSFQGEPKGKML